MKLFCLIWTLLLGSGWAVAQVKEPTYMTAPSTSGVGVPWINPSFAVGSDNMFAESEFILPGQRTRSIVIQTLTHFKEGDKFLGIEVYVERKSLQTKWLIDSVFFAMEKKGTRDTIIKFEKVVKLGGPTDLWKSTPISTALTSHLYYTVYNIGPVPDKVFLDDIRILLYYSVSSNSEGGNELAPYSNTDFTNYNINCNGTARIYSSYGILVKEITLPNSWDGTDCYGALVPSGEYTIIADGCDEMRVSVIK